MGRVLIIDDNVEKHRLVRRAFERNNARVEVLSATSAEEGFALLEGGGVDIVFVDYVQKGVNGIEFLKEVKVRGFNVPVVFIAPRGDEKVVAEAMRLGAYDYIVKDIGYFNAMPHAYKKALERFRFENEIHRIQRQMMEFNQRLLLINSLIKEINRDLSVDHAINTLLKGVIRLLSVDAGMFALIEGDSLRCIGKKNVDFDGGMFSLFAREIEGTRVIRDVRDIVGHDRLVALLEEQGVRSVVCTPVNIMTDKKGVLILFSFSETDFSEPDINSLEIFLDAGVSAIKNSFLFDLILKSQKLWQETFDAISDYVVVVDDDYRIIKSNVAFARTCGLHPREIIGRSCLDLKDKIFREFCIEELYKSGKAYTEEISCEGKVFLVSAFHVTLPDGKNATVNIMKDITEMRRLKEQLYHADKLTSLGLLVSGVAHELNNPLTGILGYSELLSMKTEDEGLKKELQKIYDAAERCKKIVENLLTFSRQSPPERSYIRIDELIDSAVELRSYWLKSNGFQIIKDYHDLPIVSIDPQQIQQVVMNILVNAEYAVLESGKEEKVITLHTHHDKEKGMIVIKISDNGIGISGDTLARIFDPFFTTKPVNKGSGLGLSISHGIVKEHNGNIWAESTPGEGTTFVIELPVAKEGPSALYL